MSDPKFVYVTYIATTPERLWQALTEGSFTRQYWGGRAIESDWTPGAPVRLHITHKPGELDIVRATVIEARPPLRLVLRWTYELESDAPQPPASRVTFVIERAGPKNVKLTLLHEEFEPGSAVDEGLRAGWAAILSSLKTLLETGEALDVTERWAQSGR